MLCVAWRRCLGTSTVRVGASATLSKSFTEAEGAEFARLTGDVNPAHFWDGFAQSLRRPAEAQGQAESEGAAVDERSGAVVHAGPLLDRKCCHGVMVLGLVSALVGTRLPGPGAVLMAHNITYRRPVYYDERVTAHGKVLDGVLLSWSWVAPVAREAGAGAGMGMAC